MGIFFLIQCEKLSCTPMNSLSTNDVYRSISQSLDHNPENYNATPRGLLITTSVSSLKFLFEQCSERDGNGMGNTIRIKNG